MYYCQAQRDVCCRGGISVFNLEVWCIVVRLEAGRRAGLNKSGGCRIGAKLCYDGMFDI
jgi:hypothetical protein